MHSPEQGRQQHDDTQWLVAKWREQHLRPANPIYCRRCRMEISREECERYLDSHMHDWYVDGQNQNQKIRTVHKAVMACKESSEHDQCFHYRKRETVKGIKAGGQLVKGLDGVVRLHGKVWNGTTWEGRDRNGSSKEVQK